MKKLALPVVLLSTTLLSACGGGGGADVFIPPPINNPTNPTNPTDPAGPTQLTYGNLVKIATVDPLVGQNAYAGAIMNTHFFDADNDGFEDDMIFLGRQTQPATIDTWQNSRISMYRFHQGQMIDVTDQWFAGDDNIILGSEPDVEFVDFFKSGRTDMFVSSSTDMNYYGNPSVFINNGSNFTRKDLATNNVWSHDADVGDLNGDGYADIFMLSYGTNTTVAYNDTVSDFTLANVRYSNGAFYGASGVTIGQFVGSGNNQLVMTDAFENGQKGTHLYSISGSILTHLAELPRPRFDLPKYDGMDLGSDNAGSPNHSVRVVTNDFNEDGVDDVIVFTRPLKNQAEFGEIQFLSNNGSGTFSDVTDTTLYGYDTAGHVTYKPTFMDINDDGKIDILVSAGDHEGENDSHQILLKTQDNKYISAYQNLLTDFMTDSSQQIAGAWDRGGTVNIFKGDDNKKYLVSWIQHNEGGWSGDRHNSLFMSELSGTNTITAASAVDMIQEQWNFVSDQDAAEILRQTGN